MEEVVAAVGSVVFDIERDLDEQVGAINLPFAGMDKSGAAVCVFHLRGACSRGMQCPYRHIKPDRTIVCKHWLRGLCKKGDSCEFLHEYDMSKMPECYFYSKFHACSNKECPFLHIDPESKIKDCPWYDRGFCRHGPMCRHRHTRRVACINYLCGFCPDGPNCKFVHMQFDLPDKPLGERSGGERVVGANLSNHRNDRDRSEPYRTDIDGFRDREDRENTIPGRDDARRRTGGLGPTGERREKGMVICHYCQEPGHKIYVCPTIPPAEKDNVIGKFLAEQKEKYGDRSNRPGGVSGGRGMGGPRGPHPSGMMMERNGPNHMPNDHSHHNTHYQDYHGRRDSGSRNIVNDMMQMGGPGGGGTTGGQGGNDSSPMTISTVTTKDRDDPMSRRAHRPLDQVTCFKCGERGHYANKCPKGYLAFLSPALNNLKQQQPPPQGGQGPGGGGLPPGQLPSSHSNNTNYPHQQHHRNNIEPMEHS